MRKIFPLIMLFIVVVSLTPVSAAISPTVRCPVPPKSQGNVNHIFFSFYKKSANIKSYIPKNLVLLDGKYTNDRARCLTEQTYAAFVAMNDALYKESNQNLVILSAWRSTATQQYFAKARGEFAAPAGRSEHQLGVAIDVNMVGSKEEDRFGDSVAYAWMKERAAEYGFVQSFTAEDAEVTGVPAEPWHWRFVGKTIATRVVTEKRNISEFLYERMEAKKKGLSY